MATKTEVAAIINALITGLPSPVQTQERVELYIAHLQDIPANDLMGAVNSLLATEEFFPSIAKIRKLCVPSDEDLNATEAWEKVVPWIECSGRRHPDLGEAIERTVRAVGGWEGLGQGLVSERKWVEKRFKESYKDICDGAEMSEARRLKRISGGPNIKRIGKGRP